MPQVDLVSACAGGGTDRKIACESQADDGFNSGDIKEIPGDDGIDSGDIEIAAPTDLPPESFWLSKDSEIDWFERNAYFERKESTKGAIPNSGSLPNPNSNSYSQSQRFSKSKASIIGLPKGQKTAYAESKRRAGNKPGIIRLFPPKRTGSVGKPVAEPSSPKVSCIGRVRSKHRRRRSSSRNENPIERSRSDRENRKPGFYSRFLAMFTSAGKKAGKERNREPPSGPAKIVKATRSCEIPLGSGQPGLGAMNRFASGRRSASWGAQEISAAVSESLSREVGRVGPRARN
ncbi:unnamed protein product [Cuscuta epithymum]|uniref:Uncharacterized protein n=1 Tax=Cuscuta epithymum TaxID=186058 RepID=A0AAV0CM44_9ASTE|nr:unnamed protein product [Cuscuta epithymum]